MYNFILRLAGLGEDQWRSAVAQVKKAVHKAADEVAYSRVERYADGLRKHRRRHDEMLGAIITHGFVHRTT